MHIDTTTIIRTFSDRNRAEEYCAWMKEALADNDGAMVSDIAESRDTWSIVVVQDNTRNGANK